MSTIPKSAKCAQRYTEVGLVLVPSAPGQKGPRRVNGWNQPQNAITDPKRALAYWMVHPEDGMAALLGPSRKVSLDIDEERLSPGVLSHLGVNLEHERESTPTIIGRHFRLMYQAPEGVELKHRTATWPKENAPGSFVLFEPRAGNVADMLPPSRHVTGIRYRWENPPKNGEFPPLPDRLLELWLNWDETNRTIRSLCPWAPPPPPPAAPQARREYSGPSVIDAFNAAHDLTAILEAHGYRRDGKRFAPAETDHDAGLVLLNNGKIFCHHAGDALHSEHALDAFDCYRILDHGGDYRAAVKAAAQALGLDRERAA